MHIKELIVMAKKYTLQINWRDKMGWSETFYTDSSVELGSAEVTTFVNTMARNRAGCLSNGAAIVGCRVSDPASPAVVRGIELNLPGTAGNGILSTDQTDVPMLSALVNFYASNGVRRSYLMRGLTDADVVEGKLTFAYTGRPAYDRWWRWVVAQTYVRDIVNGAKKDIVSVTGAGLVTTAVAHGLAAGNVVLLNTRTAGAGPKFRANGIVQSAPTATTVQLRKYTRGDAAGGEVCATTTNFVHFTSFSLKQPAYVRTRQTGGPFGALPGRR